MLLLPMTTRIAPFYLEAGALHHQDDSIWSAGPHDGQLLHKPSDVVGMEAIDVLSRIDALEHLDRSNVRRQGKLNQDSVDRGIGIQPVDQ